MGLFDKLKKKAEDLANEAGKIADKTIKDASSWTEQAVKDTKEWTGHALEDASNWTSKTISDIGEFTSETWENKEKYANNLKQWSKEMPDKIQNYSENFNVKDFWDKIAETGKKIGQEMIFMALACYYALVEFFKNNESEEEKLTQEKLTTTSIKVKAKAQNRAALGIVHAYIRLNPKTDLEQLKIVFPNETAPDKGVKELFVSPEIAKEHNEKMNLYFSKEEELISLGDGTRIALATMWTKPSFERIAKIASENLIEIEKLDMSPNKVGFELEA